MKSPSKKRQLSRTATIPRGTVSVVSARVARLSPRLQGDYGEVCQIVAGLQNHLLRGYRKLGCLVHQWRTERDEYEPNAVTLVADLCGLSEGVLYKCAQLYDSISEDEFESWVSARMADTGGALTWTHATWLILVKDAAQRQDLFERTMRESLSSAELEQQVRALNDGVSQRPGSGRKFAKLPDESKFCGNFTAVATDIVRRVEQLWQPTLKEFAEREPSLTAIGDLDTALRRHDSLLQAVARQRDMLLGVRNKYASALHQPTLALPAPAAGDTSTT